MERKRVPASDRWQVPSTGKRRAKERAIEIEKDRLEMSQVVVHLVCPSNLVYGALECGGWTPLSRTGEHQSFVFELPNVSWIYCEVVHDADAV